MSNTKRCSGYKGHWECSEEYSDHMVPIENFGPDGDGLQGMCRKCFIQRSSIRNPKENPIANAISKEAYSYVGGSKAFYALDAKTRKEVRAKARVTLEAEGRLPLIIEQTNNILQITPRTWTNNNGELKTANSVTLKSTVRNNGLPEGIVTPSEKKVIREKKKIKYVPEGWIYAARDWMKQREENYHKLGKTNDLERRLKEFNTAGDFEMMYWVKVPDVKKAEDMLHDHFRGHQHLREWFKVDLEDVIEVMDAIGVKMNDPNWEGDASENAISQG